MKKYSKIFGLIIAILFIGLLGWKMPENYNKNKENKIVLKKDKEATVLMKYNNFNIIYKYVDLNLYDKDLSLENEGTNIFGYTTIGRLVDIDMENKTMILNGTTIVQLTEDQIMKFKNLKDGIVVRIFFTQAIYEDGYFIIQGDVLPGLTELPLNKEFKRNDIVIKFLDKNAKIK